MKYRFLYALLMLFATKLLAQTPTNNKKFGVDNSVQKYLGKPKYLPESKQSISLLLDDYFVFKTLGLGYQRKLGKLMIDVQGSKGIQNMGKGILATQSDVLSKMVFDRITSYNSIDTSRQNYGVQLGLYNMSKLASMTGFLMGLTTTYDAYNIKYTVYDNNTGNYNKVDNNLNRIGAYLTVGARAILIKNFGICFTGGVGYRHAFTGASTAPMDDYNNVKRGTANSFGNIRLFKSF